MDEAVPPPLDLPGLSQIQAARRRIAAHIHTTPLFSCRSFGERHGAEVHLKAENLQRTGSFKIRGALNALLTARETGRIAGEGVITYSSGNHGQAVALAARILGVRAIVVVPRDIARVKQDAIAGYGAQVVPCGTTSEDRREEAERLAKESGATIIPPYDHPDIIAGQGTIALEVLEALPGADVIIVPVGGGGLISGVAIGTKSLRPEALVFGAEPATSNDMALSLAAGKRVRIDPSRTIADGLRAITPGVLTFEAAQRHLSGVLCVEEAQIRDAQRSILERAKLLVEPSGAVGVAAYLAHGERFAGKKVVAVLSGGNADLPPLEFDAR